MGEEVMEISSNDYFRVDLQDRLPLGEVKRRLAIKERLESQFERWQSDEQYGSPLYSLTEMLMSNN